MYTGVHLDVSLWRGIHGLYIPLILIITPFLVCEFMLWVIVDHILSASVIAFIIPTCASQMYIVTIVMTS